MGRKMRFDCSTPPAPHIKGLRKKCTFIYTQHKTSIGKSKQTKIMFI